MNIVAMFREVFLEGYITKNIKASLDYKKIKFYV